MSSILTTLGLRAAPPGEFIPNYAAGFLIGNFVLAYALFSTRGVKKHYGMDHNACPRQDVQKYGEQMVHLGKIKRGTLEMIQRWEALHANIVEGYPLFVGAVLLALHAGVPTQSLNFLMATYTASRIAHGLAYILIQTESLSYLRSVLWWSGNISCLALMWKAGKNL